MGKKSALTAVKHLIYTSPILPLICLAIFSFYILAQFVHVPLISSLGPTLLLVSNISFLLIIALRVLCRVQGMWRDHGCDKKINLGHLGSTIAYGGLLITLLIGTCDYLRQYSGAVFQGIGQAMDLSDRKCYFSVDKGPLASTSGLPQLMVKKQILPNQEWPKGATQIALLAKDQSVMTTGVVGASGGEPLKFKGYEYHFNRFLYDAMIAIKTSNGHVEFDDMIKLQPADHPEGNYTFSSRFRGERYRWIALFDPARKALRLVALDKKGAHVEDGVIAFQKEPTKDMGTFAVEFSALSQWSEMHVVRTRHMYLLVAGLLIAAAGALLRLCCRPRRARRETETAERRIWSPGKETVPQG